MPDVYTLRWLADKLDTTYNTLARLAKERDGVIVTDAHGNPIVTAEWSGRSWWVTAADVDRLFNFPDLEPDPPSTVEEEPPMPPTSQPPVRANLSVGPIKCEVRTPEPLTAEQWQLVSTLADAVRDAATKLDGDGDG